MKTLSILLLSFALFSCNDEKPEDQPKPKPTSYDVKLTGTGVDVYKVKFIYFKSGIRTITEKSLNPKVSLFDTTLNMAVNDSIGFVVYSTANTKAIGEYDSRRFENTGNTLTSVTVKVQN